MAPIEIKSNAVSRINRLMIGLHNSINEMAGMFDLIPKIEKKTYYMRFCIVGYILLPSSSSFLSIVSYRIVFSTSEYIETWSKYLISFVLPMSGACQCYEMKMHYSCFAEVYTTSNCK